MNRKLRQNEVRFQGSPIVNFALCVMEQSVWWICWIIFLCFFEAERLIGILSHCVVCLCYSDAVLYKSVQYLCWRKVPDGHIEPLGRVHHPDLSLSVVYRSIDQTSSPSIWFPLCSRFLFFSLTIYSGYVSKSSSKISINHWHPLFIIKITLPKICQSQECNPITSSCVPMHTMVWDVRASYAAKYQCSYILQLPIQLPMHGSQTRTTWAISICRSKIYGYWCCH